MGLVQFMGMIKKIACPSCNTTDLKFISDVFLVSGKYFFYCHECHVKTEMKVFMSNDNKIQVQELQDKGDKTRQR